MMKFLTAVLFLISSTVFAKEIKIYEAPADFFRPHARSTFALNMNLGRAWVETEMYDGLGNEGAGSVWTRTKVEGLVFDNSSSKITFTHEGQLIDCANVVKRWFGVRIYPTNCSLKTRKVRLTTDDGYRRSRGDFIQVFLVTK